MALQPLPVPIVGTCGQGLERVRLLPVAVKQSASELTGDQVGIFPPRDLCAHPILESGEPVRLTLGGSFPASSLAPHSSPPCAESPELCLASLRPGPLSAQPGPRSCT